jgi:hypothetical protein
MIPQKSRLAACAFAAVCALLLFQACSGSRSTQGNDKQLQTLLGYMAGSFNSCAQAARDSNYFDISLSMTPIWQGKHDGHWLYVEQAVTAKLDKPYRQRIYNVRHEADGSFVSEVYTLPDEAKYIGAGKNTALLDGLTPSQLELRSGCAVVLRKEGNAFAGSTVGNGCESSLRGAAYATSKVTITKGLVKSWDQGFDTSGKQVWGATEGPYEFVKQN